MYTAGAHSRRGRAGGVRARGRPRVVRGAPPPRRRPRTEVDRYEYPPRALRRAAAAAGRAGPPVVHRGGYRPRGAAARPRPSLSL